MTNTDILTDTPDGADDFVEFDVPDDWEDDDDDFLNEYIELEDQRFVREYTATRKGTPLDFDYDYDRDDYPYGYGKD